MKKLLSIFSLLILMISVCSIAAFPVGATDGINYDDWQIYDGTIIRYVGTAEEVVVPTVDDEGYPIIAIGQNAFSGPDEQENTTLKKVVVPEGILTIAGAAFEYCVKLVEVSLPYSLKTMEMSCFRRCKMLESIVIPPKVEEITTGAFSGCYRLSDIVISHGVKKIQSRAFGSTAASEIIIPDSVVLIEGSAFYYLTAEVGESFDLYITNDNITLGKMDTKVYNKYDPIAPIVELAGHNATTKTRIFAASKSETDIFMSQYMPNDEFVPTEKQILDAKNEWCKANGVQPPKEEEKSDKGDKTPLVIALSVVGVLALLKIALVIIRKKKTK